MISFPAILAAALLALLVWTATGLALMRRILPGQSPLIAPALGYAAFSAASLPLYGAVGLSLPACLIGLGLVIILAFFALRGWTASAPLPWFALAGAAALAVIPALCILPKMADSVFAIQIFDHAKIALIDEIQRSGVPPANVFVADGGGGLAYYYLYYFAAALFGKAVGAGGWESDIAAALAIGFASLCLMIGIVSRWRRAAALWVLPLCLAVSTRPFLNDFLIGPDFGHWITGYPGLQAWLVQASWVPQHLAAANCLCLLPLLLVAIRGSLGLGDKLLAILCLGLVIAAGFESSTYIGGVLLAITAPFWAIALLWGRPGKICAEFLLACLLAGGVALALIAPMLAAQWAATAARGVGFPIGLHLFEVFEAKIPEAWRPWLDAPGFWLVQLPIDLPAIGLLGLWSMRANRLSLEQRLFAILSLARLMTAWLLESRIANNDLGWRALLPAVIGLTLFASHHLAGLSWRAPGKYLALLPVALGLYGGVVYFHENLTGDVTRGDPGFGDSAALWQAVRANSGVEERVANNPQAFATILRWPVNLSWALLAGRRSCFAGHELVLAYGALPAAEIERRSQLFERIFAGAASADEIHALGPLYHCDLIALTARDGAWRDDPFAKDPGFRLVAEQKESWRVYRAPGD